MAGKKRRSASTVAWQVHKSVVMDRQSSRWIVTGDLEMRSLHQRQKEADRGCSDSSDAVGTRIDGAGSGECFDCSEEELSRHAVNFRPCVVQTPFCSVKNIIFGIALHCTCAVFENEDISEQ